MPGPAQAEWWEYMDWDPAFGMPTIYLGKHIHTISHHDLLFIEQINNCTAHQGSSGPMGEDRKGYLEEEGVSRILKTGKLWIQKGLKRAFQERAWAKVWLWERVEETMRSLNLAQGVCKWRRGIKLERTGAGSWKATNAVLRSMVLWEPQKVLEQASGVAREAC